MRLVCLSATVSNADELAEWITTVRGPTAEIVERQRPVRLDNLYLVGDKTNDRLQLLPVFVNGHVNREAVQLDESAVRGRYGGRAQRPRIIAGDQGSGRRVLAPPGRVETVELLDPAACCRRSTSSSAAASATRRPRPASTPAST